MTPKWIERQVDEAILLVAVQASMLYLHRRARRLFPKAVIGALAITGLGAVAAATAAGLGAVGVAGGAAAAYRYRTRNREAVAPAGDTWAVTGAGNSPVTAVDPKPSGTASKDA